MDDARRHNARACMNFAANNVRMRTTDRHRANNHLLRASFTLTYPYPSLRSEDLIAEQRMGRLSSNVDYGTCTQCVLFTFIGFNIFGAVSHVFLRTPVMHGGCVAS